MKVMKKISLFLFLGLITNLLFSQAREEGDEEYKTIYSILFIKEGEVKHTIKQGLEVNVEIDDKRVYGRWFFKSYPDVISVVNRKGEVLGEVALNQQKSIRVETPQQRGGLSVGVGIGPVGVSSGGGGMQSFNMDKWKAEISERPETKEEKLKREYYEKKEQERLAKQAAKEAKKAAKKKKK